MLGLHNTGNDHSPHRAADCLSYEGVVRAVINRPFAAGAKTHLGGRMISALTGVL